jgi:hypothetical protein
LQDRLKKRTIGPVSMPSFLNPPLPIYRLTSPAKVARIKLRASEWPNLEVLAASQPNSAVLDEAGVLGPVLTWAAVIVVKEASVDIGNVAVLTLLGDGGGADD